MCGVNSVVFSGQGLVSGTWDDGGGRELRRNVCHNCKQGWKENSISLCVQGAMIRSHMQMKLWRES